METCVQFMYSPHAVHVQFIYDQNYSKEEQQTSPPNQLKWLCFVQ